MAEAGDFDGLAAPTRRALAGAGFRRLEDLCRAREEEVAALHGMGPNAMKRLKEKLAARRLGFAEP